jgi:N-methylhydantoinase B
LIFETPGGGGFGDPEKRDRAALRRDLEEGLVSLAAATSLYGGLK